MQGPCRLLKDWWNELSACPPATVNWSRQTRARPNRYMPDIPCQERWKLERPVIVGVVARRRDHGEYRCPPSPPSRPNQFCRRLQKRHRSRLPAETPKPCPVTFPGFQDGAFSFFLRLARVLEDRARRHRCISFRERHFVLGVRGSPSLRRRAD
jgi:hypothetical protein